MQTIQKAILFVTLSLAIGTFSFAQKSKSGTVATLVKAMANSNVYEVSYAVGYAGAISKQYQRFEQLLSVATEQQLIALAAHNKNAVVRLYAFQALKQKKAKIPEALTEQFQKDRTIVTMLNGCVGSKRAVHELAQQTLKLKEDLIE